MIKNSIGKLGVEANFIEVIENIGLFLASLPFL